MGAVRPFSWEREELLMEAKLGPGVTYVEGFGTVDSGGRGPHFCSQPDEGRRPLCCAWAPLRTWGKQGSFSEPVSCGNAFSLLSTPRDCNGFQGGWLPRKELIRQQRAPGTPVSQNTHMGGRE